MTPEPDPEPEPEPEPVNVHFSIYALTGNTKTAGYWRMRKVVDGVPVAPSISFSAFETDVDVLTGDYFIFLNGGASSDTSHISILFDGGSQTVQYVTGTGPGSFITISGAENSYKMCGVGYT